MAKNILITGGIGTGKSTCAKFFTLLGVPLFNDDLVGRFLTDYNLYVKQAIVNLFDSSIYVDGMLDRKRVASIVFKDKKILSDLSAIIHPAVQRSYLEWRVQNQYAHYTLRESALANNDSRLFDAVIVVDAPLELRVNRVVKRDNCSSEEVIRRINSQITQESRLEMANFIVLCDDKQLVIPQILNINNSLLNQ